MSFLFEESVAAIEDSYRQLGHSLGWRFLYGSKRTLESPVDIAFFTINPGGNEIPTDHPWASCENGVAYLNELWGKHKPGEHKLQVQVQRMFALIDREANLRMGHEKLMANSLLSHLIPFRSPRFDSLANEKESTEFARDLWGRILPHASPRLIICLGRNVQKEMCHLISGSLGPCTGSVRSFPTGWGSYNAELQEFSGPRGVVKLLYLPHLSTWTLFTRQECMPHVTTIIREASADIW